jgi:hypothetical protein
MAAGTDTLSMITADLAAPDTAAAPEAPPISQETIAEVNGIPEDEQPLAPPAEAGEIENPPADEAPPAAEPSEDEKPQIENLTDSRWKTVHAGYKYVRELGKALGLVGEDGRVDLSLFPPIEQVQGMQTAYSDRMAMEHDFASADPQNAAQFIDNWNQFSPQGMQTVAAQLPDYLAKSNPDAYRAVAAPVLQRALDYMYSRGAQFEDEGMRKYVLDSARAMEWWLAGGPDAPQGSYRSDDQIQALMSQRPGAAPNQTEQRLAEAQRQLQSLNKQTADARWNGFYQAAVADIHQGIATDVEKTLSPLKPHYPNELTFNAVKNDFLGQVQKVMDKDSAGRRQYDLAVERARRTQTESDREAIKSAWLNMTRRAIHTIRGKFIAEASKGIVQASNAKHAALAKSASKVGPASGGAPRQQSIVTELKRNPGESLSEFQFRQIAADMSR